MQWVRGKPLLVVTLLGHECPSKIGVNIRRGSCLRSLHTLNRYLQLLHLMGEQFHCIRALISIRILLIRKHNLALAGTLLLVARRLSSALLPIQLLYNLPFSV